MMNLPTRKNVVKYLENPNICPFCGSDVIEVQDPFIIADSSKYANQYVQCSICKKQWRHEYQLIAISVRPATDDTQHDTWYSDEALYLRHLKTSEEYYTHEPEYEELTGILIKKNDKQGSSR